MIQHKFFSTIVIFLVCGASLVSQTTDDALRYAIYQPMGSARSMSIGNAISSLGGDFFTMSHNPAGLASFRKSEFTLTQGFQSTNTTASLAGSGDEEIDFDYMVTSLGMVITQTNHHTKWKAVNFGLGYNRFTNYDRHTYYSGSTVGSISDSWLEEYQNNDELLPYAAGLASEADIFIQDGNGEISTDYELDGRGMLPKRENITSSGGAGEMTVGFAANYNHRLYFGLTIGVPIINFEQKRIYEEIQDQTSENIFFRALTYEENLEQSGSGINAKMGLIYRVNQPIRVSAYYHTPQVLSILDEFSNSIEYSYFDVDRNPQTAFASYPPSGEGTLNFEYQVITPGRVGGGASFIFGKNGFLSAEVAYTDYANTRFNFDADLSNSEDLAYEKELNQEIDRQFDNALTFRLGGELAIDNFRLRAGTILDQSPYANDDEYAATYTAGAGLRFNKFFIDLGYRRAERQTTHLPYLTFDRELYPIQEVDKSIVDHEVFLTLGLKFNN